ncbi:MAG: chemotaxis protein [Pleurocapsa sp. CRU_1_2]|nr:chemotaxis protein [Pleurocapsa sp. CRU_1_2]
MFKELKLRNRILIGYILPLISLIGASAITLWNANRIKSIFQEVKRVDKEILETQKLENSVNAMILGARGHVINPSDVYIKEYRHGSKDFTKVMTTLEESDVIIQENEAEQEQYFQELIILGEQIQKDGDNIIRLVQQGKQQEATAIATNELGSELDRQLIALYAQLDESEQQEINQKVTQNIIQAENTLNTLVWVFLIGALGLGGLTTVIALIVASKATKIILQSIGKISSSSSQIAVTVEEQERNANLQAAAVNETTTAMDELEATSRQSAEQANAAALAAEQVFQLSDNGNQAVEETLGEMTNLRSKVTAIAEQIMQLSEQTIQIGNISGLVSDLANQTNILALNAAVEAVRAGEHGKGFSVVAAEIRKLADQSKNSAENIRTLVNEIQHKINSAVMVTDEGSKTVDSGIQIANRTAESFAGVAEAVNNMVINNQQISLNTKQQVQAIQQVVEAMNNINLGAKETAIGISQTKEGTSQLNEATINLQKIV